MSHRILTLAIFSVLGLSAAACNSALGPNPGSVAASQGSGTSAADATGDQLGADIPADSLATQPVGYNWGAGNPGSHDVGDDRGVDDPATHDVGDDRGVDDPATHDVGDDRGGNDDPANHQ